MPPLAGRRPAARRLAAALFERGGDALAHGVRVVTGRAAGDAAPTAIEPARAERAAASDESARRAAAAEEAAARLDAARERLRATIAPPADDAPEDDATESESEPVPADGDPPSPPPSA